MAGLVSIIMPVYNARAYVGQAIQSVLDQTWTDWELLVINDGSTDNSLECIQSFCDPRIRIFKQEFNKGVSAARNLGLMNMRGDFFCFLDADDVLPPKSVESRLHVFDDHVSFADGRVDYYDESLGHKIKQWLPRTNGNVLKKLARLDSACFFGPTWMIKVQSGVQYRFDESLTHCEDLLFFMGIAQTGQYAYTNEIILKYRDNKSSAMKNTKGLARGYTMLRQKMDLSFITQLSGYDKLVFNIKVRKIMFLTFIRSNQLLSAARYVILGRL